MHTEDSDYNKQLDNFGEDNFKAWYMSIYDDIVSFIDRFDLDNISICEVALQRAILDCLDDLYRICSFHQIQNVNDIKITAYIAYWLLRRHPLMVVDGNCDYEFINEKYVNIFICSQIMRPDQKTSASICAFIDLLLYYTKYRLVTPQVYEVVIQAFISGYQTDEEIK